MLSQLQVDTQEKTIIAIRVVLDKARIEQERKLRELEKNEENNGESEFDLSKQVRLVAKFSKEKVNDYFKHFVKTEKWHTSRCSWTVVQNT